MSAQIPPVSSDVSKTTVDTLQDLMKNEQTVQLLSNSLIEKLKSQFPDTSLGGIYASIQTVLPDVLDKVCNETLSWKSTRTNYEEAVVLVAKRALTKCEKLVQNIEPDTRNFIHERPIAPKEKSVSEL